MRSFSLGFTTTKIAKTSSSATSWTLQSPVRVGRAKQVRRRKTIRELDSSVTRIDSATRNTSIPTRVTRKPQRIQRTRNPQRNVRRIRRLTYGPRFSAVRRVARTHLQDFNAQRRERQAGWRRPANEMGSIARRIPVIVHAIGLLANASPAGANAFATLVEAMKSQYDVFAGGASGIVAHIFLCASGTCGVMSA